MRVISILFLITISLFADSFVWKVQKGDSTLYLGGTIHLLRPADFPLPKEFESAYKRSEVLVFETQIDRLEDPSFQEFMMQSMLYNDGSTLKQHLQETTYKRLEEYCQDNNISLQNMQQMKASMVALALMQMRYMELGATQDGVDRYYYQKAVADKKKSEYFETLEEQVGMIANIGGDDEDDFVLQTLSDIKELDTMFTKIVQFWKNGKEKELSDFFILDLKKQSRQLYNDLIVKRNIAWLPQIKHYLTTEKTEFILVGAGHLVGPDGLLQALKKEGYKVTKL
ncbi:TraB/GumN family protein [Sulfurimonas marina]|uniref:TraB/GumN family protein n=1 Tax=Sulfurimonas marina TaxID=2590551 RepID=A0A7M1AZ39_9BACT|nr:TraB/GumN family protein [Sulfurimonas marina]QOP41818.1 TraB/GumN family protein [Sulfurimonas marina]